MKTTSISTEQLNEELLALCKRLLDAIEGTPDHVGLLDVADGYYQMGQFTADLRAEAKLLIQRATVPRL